jgi:hypothetical protein
MDPLAWKTCWMVSKVRVFKLGYEVTQLVEALIQAGMSRLQFLIVSLEFFIAIILSAALLPWG